MTMAVQYDDSQLQRLFAELEPKKRLSALRGGFRKAANKLRAAAINNLRASVKSNRDLERGVRAMVFKRQAGFRVTVGTKRANKKTGKGEKGYHTNRKGWKKPVLIWAEDGTAERSYRTKYGRTHRTGAMRRYGFMAKAKEQVAGTITDDLHELIRENIVTTAKRYGCI